MMGGLLGREGEAEMRLVMKRIFISISHFKYGDCGDMLDLAYGRKHRHLKKFSEK